MTPVPHPNDSYNCRLLYNKENLIWCISENIKYRDSLTTKSSRDPRHIFWFDGMYFVRGNKYLPVTLYESKPHDFKSSMIVGAVPILEKSGADAIWINSNTDEIEEIELKLGTINSNRIFFGPTGGRYHVAPGTTDKKTLKDAGGVSGNSAGAWALTAKNWDSKNRTTVVIIQDEDTGKLIEIRWFTGTAIMKLFGQKPKLFKRTEKRHISIGQFLSPDNGKDNIIKYSGGYGDFNSYMDEIKKKCIHNHHGFMTQWA